MEEELSKSQIDEIKEVFSYFDDKNDMTIPTEKLEILLRMLGLNPTQKDLRDIINDLDPYEEGKLNFEDFYKTVIHYQKNIPKHEDIIVALQAFDTDGDGYLTRDQVKDAIVHFGEKLSDEEIDQMIEHADDQGTGRVHIEKFVELAFS